jgi:hypothetical protein
MTPWLIVAALLAQVDGGVVVEAPAAEKVKLSGRAFLRYSYDFTSRASFNEFAIDRLYLIADYQMTERVKTQVLLEAGDIRTNGTDNFQVAPKYAFVQLNDLGYAGTYVAAGLVRTSWISPEEETWGHRVQGPVFLERSGYGSSGDLGLGFGGPIFGKYGQWQGNFVDGETWKKKEIGKRKEAQLRVTVKPLAALAGPAPGVFITGFAAWGEYDDSPGSKLKRRYIAQAGIKRDKYLAAAQYLWTVDPTEKYAARYVVGPPGTLATGGGYCFYGWLDLGLFAPAANGVQVIGRVDRWVPDTEIERTPPLTEELDTGVTTVIAGAAYLFNDKLKVVLDYETVHYGADTFVRLEERLKLHLDARF